MQITLKAARVNAGMTRKDVEKSVGINAETLKGWEYGKFEPRAKMFLKLCHLYNVAPTDIFLP